jgi:hypothetical protein
MNAVFALPKNFLNFALLGLLVGAIPVFAQTPANSPVSNQASANWAGYVAQTDTYSGVGATWSIPTPSVGTTTRSSADATWVGIGGVSSSDLIQAGTQASVDNGQVTYEAWYETLPRTQKIIPLVVHGGDSVTVSLKETSSDVWQLTFNNNTTGQQYQRTISYASSKSSAEWIEEMPVGVTGASAGYIPLDNFGSAQFVNGYAVVNGSQETLSQAGAQPLRMVWRGSQALATPSAVGSDGASFTVNRSALAINQTTTRGGGGRGWHRGGRGVSYWSFPMPYSVRVFRFTF